MSKLRRFLNVGWRNALALAMLPLFVVGTLPQSVCICADGHRGAACPKLKLGSEKRGRSCCALKHHEGTSGQSPASGIGARVASCCQVMIEGPPATLAAKDWGAQKSTLGLGLHDSAVSHVADVSIRPFLCDVELSQPPPRDAVILFLRLTI